MLSIATESSFYMHSQECDDDNHQEQVDSPTIPGFHFVDKIGDSGCSSNFLYRDNIGELYVAKVLYNNCASFEKEIEFLNFFKEDREVVDIAYDIKNNGMRIIMTKYCEYGDLYNFINNMGEISFSLFLKIFIQLIKAVDLLHVNNIYHGDIKPANFFVRDYDEETEDIQIVIADFGFAKDLDNTTGYLYPDGYTPGYSAPEIERCEQVSLASDIFSLGKVLEFIYNYVNENIPCSIFSMINKMMEEYPEDRPTIHEIIDELMKLQSL